MIAVDSSVLVDVLAGDPRFADVSLASLGEALGASDVVVCDAVVVEIHTLLAGSESTTRRDAIEDSANSTESTTTFVASNHTRSPEWPMYPYEVSSSKCGSNSRRRK